MLNCEGPLKRPRTAPAVLSKGHGPERVELDQLDDVCDGLNDRPRACLNDRSPRAAMQRLGHRMQTHLIRNVH